MDDDDDDDDDDDGREDDDERMTMWNVTRVLMDGWMVECGGGEEAGRESERVRESVRKSG